MGTSSYDLRIGDSIVKKAQSKKFVVYRKNAPFEYQLIHTYIYDTKTYTFFHPESNTRELQH